VNENVAEGTAQAPFVFRAEQFVDRPVPEVFAFFAQAENLQRLTPDWLHFKILGIDPNPVREGALIGTGCGGESFRSTGRRGLRCGILRIVLPMSN